LRAQEKVPKEKGTRRPHRLPPMPCVPRQSGGAHNSEFSGAGKPAPENLPRTGCAPLPGLAAVLGECHGTGGDISKPRWRRRASQGTRVAGKPSGPRFFWVLFFGGAKKSTSPERAKPGLKDKTRHSIAARAPLLQDIERSVGAHGMRESSQHSVDSKLVMRTITKGLVVAVFAATQVDFGFFRNF